MNQPMKYRKKPVEVEARQWDGTALAATEIISWMTFHNVRAEYFGPEPETLTKMGIRIPERLAELYIETLEGTMIAEVGDYIIKGVQNEFYPCKPDIFKQTYEEA